MAEAGDYEIALDAHGDLVIGDGAPGLLGMFLRCDVQTDQRCCAMVRRAIADACSGAHLVRQLTFDTMRLTITPDGATLRVAATLTHNAPVPLGLDDLEAALIRVRTIVSARDDTT